VAELDGWKRFESRAGVAKVSHNQYGEPRAAYPLPIAPRKCTFTGDDMRATVLILSLCCLVPSRAAAQDSTQYRRSSAGTRWLESDAGLSIKVLVESAVLGGSNVEIAEATFLAGMGAGPASHRHGSTEIIYVVAGELDHVVNGESHRLTPGMVGIVKPADTVIHRVVGQAPVKVLLIWAPGGEVERLARVLRQRPIG